MYIWVGKNGALQWKDVDDNKPKTKKYKMRVFTSKVEIIEIEAKDKQSAIDNWWEGEVVDTFPKSENTEIIKEEK